MNITTGVRSAINSIEAADTTDDLELAGRLVDEAVLTYPESAEIWAYAANLLLWRGRMDEARSALSKARELGPDLATTWAAEAGILSFEGAFDEAVLAADRALAVDDNIPWVIERCKDAYLSGNDHDKAIALSFRLCELLPDSDRVLVDLTTTLSLCGRTIEAEKITAEAMQRFPDSPHVWKVKARACIKENRFDEAIHYFSRIVEKVPGHYMAWSEMAIVLAHTSRFEEAEQAAKRSLEINTRSNIAMQALSKVHLHRGQHREAKDWLEKSKNAIPAMQAMAYLTDANVALKQGDMKKVVRLIDTALPKLLPHTRCVALGIKARALVGLRRTKALARVLAELESYDDTSSLVVFECKGKLFECQGNLDDAVATYQKGISIYPKSGNLRAELLKVLHRLKRKQEADSLIEDTWNNLPTSPLDFAALIVALDQLGYVDDYRTMLATAAERFPNDETITMLKAVDRFVLGDTTVAKEIAKNLKGDMHGLAQFIQRGATVIEHLQQWVDRILKKKNDGQPPTLN